MDNIIEPNASFDFSKLTLAHPIGIQGGAYFTKIEYNSKQNELLGKTKKEFDSYLNSINQAENKYLLIEDYPFLAN